jgi:hypothetical protein
MSRAPLAALLLVALAGPATAQPTGGQVQPDRLPLGTVYTGATVEASFMVFEAGTDPDIKMEVKAPKFVKVLKTGTHHQEFGPGNDFVCGTVELAVDTTTPGELTGEITVTLGKTTARVPVSATVKARRPGLTRVLVAGTPFERYTTSDAGVFGGWTGLVDDASLDVSYLLVRMGKPVLRDLDLGKFDCLLLPADGLVYQTPDDVRRARAYAEVGGRVVVTASAFYLRSVDGANAVLAGYGLEMRDEEAGGDAADVTLGKADLDPELVRAGVTSARFFRGSPIAVTDPKAGRVLARASGVGQPGDGFVAVAKAGKGQVVALGESLWWHWVSKEQARGTDNAKLLGWLLAPKRQA